MYDVSISKTKTYHQQEQEEGQQQEIKVNNSNKKYFKININIKCSLVHSLYKCMRYSLLFRLERKITNYACVLSRRHVNIY